MLSAMRLLCGLLVMLLSSAAVNGQTGDGLYGNTYTLTDHGHGVHTLTWNQKPGTFAIGNATFIIGDDDVIVVDSGFSRATGQAILEGLRKITAKPVAFIVNTHWHADHIFGNQVFRSAFPSARFIAHPATREGVITGESDYRDANRPKTLARIDALRAIAARSDAENQELQRAEMQIEAWQGDYVLPDLLVDSKLTIVQGKRQVHVMHLGEANTKGDLVVHLPAERIAISGDMAITPMQFAFLSSPRKWIATLDRLAAIDPAVIVPGHGPVQTDRRYIADLQAMLRSVVEQVDAGIKAGLTLEALQQSVKVTPPAGSIYAKASAAALDRLFRLPAIESAFNERP
jgi:cyclase